MMLSLRSAVSIAFLSTLAACGLNAAGDLTGVDEADGGEDVNVPRMEAGNPDSRTKTPDAHTPDAHAHDGTTPPKDSGHDSGHDTGVDSGHDSGHDAGVDTGPPPCPATPDCSNPNCTAEGYICVPPPPGGWTLANLDITTDSACPAGYTPIGTEVTAPNADPAVCSCACGVGDNPSCETGNIDVAYGTTNQCNAGTSTFMANGGTCTPTTATFEPFVKATIPGPTGGTCAAAETTTKPATESIPAYVCAATAATSTTGCNGGDVCTATTSARANHCILQSGGATCPGGTYPSPHPIGTSVTDTRTCTGACTCGGPTGGSCNATWTFYAMGNCTGGSKTVDLDGSCDATGATTGNTYASYKYVADFTGTATCGAATSSPTPTGNATLVGESMLCCSE